MANVIFNGTPQPQFPDPNAVLTGTGFSDSFAITGTLGKGTINGAADDDTIGYAGGSTESLSNVLLDGGSEDDDFYFNGIALSPATLNKITVEGGANDDYFSFGYEPAPFPLNPGYKVSITDSVIRGGGSSTSAVEPDGDDYFDFGSQTSVSTTLINGNQGNDDLYFYGSLSKSTVQGGQGDDYFYAEGGISDTRFNGNLGDDYISIYDTSASNSSVFGGQGNDYLAFDDAAFTNSLVSGDIGADFIDFYADGSNSLTVFADNSTILGGADADTIEFNNYGYYYYSNYAGQVISSLVDAGSGKDNIFVGEDARISTSTLLGGTGDDTITVLTSYDTYTSTSGPWGGLFYSVVDAGSDNDLIQIGQIGDSDAGITSIFGGSGNDTISGDDFGSVKVGAFWSGDEGNDRVTGSDGNDTILGGTGNDVIDGRDGGDSITGGAGNDTFKYGNYAASNVTGNSNSLGSKIDTITDFDTATDRFSFAGYNTVVELRTPKARDFGDDWQSTINGFLGANGGGYALLANNQVAIIQITGTTNAGTYAVYQSNFDGQWNAADDGIVRMTNPTGSFTDGNFVDFTTA